MKNKLLIIFVLLCSLILLTSCKEDKVITCQDIIRVYEEAGYEVFHKEATDVDSEWECYVKCTAPDSEDYIFFRFFEDAEGAEEYADDREWNMIVFLYSCALFEPTWLTTKTYNNIEIEYHNSYLYKPFKSLR